MLIALNVITYKQSQSFIIIGIHHKHGGDNPKGF